MSRLLAAITLPLSIALTILVTIICSVPIIIAGLIKLLVPIPAVWHAISRFCNFMMYCWCEGLALLLYLNPRLTWDVQGLEGLSKKNWYLLISNHHSWADIVVLCVLFRKHIPMNKYFLKQQLAWVPFIGLACWALDMPFMRRYSRGYLIRHPERRGKDVETTRRSCEKFRSHPTTIVNFVEGSRFTEDKQRQTRSPYRNLLPPKAAGIAMALNVLGAQFDKLLNVTLCYPENNQRPFYDMLSGRLTRIVVRVNLIPVAEDLHGDYVNDKNFKRRFQRWLNELWEEKDCQLTEIMRTKGREER
ncbi:TPA: acyltransferase [Raoultella ornithinolytica]|uniref:acyltransferase n=1 Tax=Raoultella ornithinolytica TaxID=54291 RepID=UPI0005CAF515|nr:acyltransferase [Raoultella ornithinolytica]ALQ49287.1 1-acyl-sn-glycerol-3-phosphate acyltransferase [Raoultella ornithinolytica]ATM23547.1 acyltransferase [Raoultella ornithinolytica]EKX4893514.1 acyltransferase [Raoultella ornithinolytica]ELS1888163.1 acyltransferase [Raoultella ornithinolytica]KAB8130324.1 acyltransferase [Raoultella ornithinolytica]